MTTKITEYVIESKRTTRSWSISDIYALLSEARQEIKGYKKNGIFKKYRIVKRVTTTTVTATVIE